MFPLRRLSAVHSLALAISVSSTVAAAPSVLINEVHFAEDDPTVHSEFIELHNFGAVAVDIGNWEVEARELAYLIPAGTQIAGGSYAIICEDPATIQSKWNVSGVGVLNWNQGVVPPVYARLRNGGDTIVLRDALGEKVDEVDFQLGFPWPTVGDPPNYSIELIHPSLDNSLGGHWRRSDGGSSVVEPIIQIPTGSAGWHYRKALSEASSPTDAWRGTAFIEDGSWLTSANGAPFGYGDPTDTVLSDMRNATSPPGYTGIYLRHTFTMDGPAPGPLTLRVWNDDGFVAWINGQEVGRYGPAQGVFMPFTGTAGRSHEGYNQLPDVITISAPNAILNPGSTNVLSIHAMNETLNGSSDFYLDADLRFEGGSSGGGPTPRAVNSVFAANAPPAVRQVVHEPVTPVIGQSWIASGQDVRVTAKITDPSGVATASLAYQTVNPGDYITIDDPRYAAAASWTTVLMGDGGTNGDVTAGDAIFSAIIPGSAHTHRRLIRYRISAEDTAAAAIRVPYPDDPQPNFAYFIYDNVPAWTGRATPAQAPVTYTGPQLSELPIYHLITTVAEHANAQNVPVTQTNGTPLNPTAGAYGHSQYLWKGALCYDGIVYDHIRFRARGGVWRFSMGKNMWKFDFNKGHDLQVRDNYGRELDQKWKKLNFSACIQQGDFQHRGEQGLFESVGFRLFQLTGMPAEHTQFAHFRIIEHPDENNASASQFDDDFQGLYLAIEQQDGQFLDEHGLPDGNLYKMEGGTGELNNQGPTHPKNKSDLNTFLSYGTTEQWWRTNCDLENYYNYRAIIDGIHHYDIGDGKNYFYYHNPETSKWTALAWDLDLTWSNNMYRSDSGIAGLPPSGNTTEPFFSRVFGNGSTTGIPVLRTELRNRVREILDLLFNPEQTGMLIDEMASFVYRPGVPSFVDADRAMWDYNPILVSGFVNPSKAGHGRFYQSAVNDPTTPVSELGTFPGMMVKMKNYVVTRHSVMMTQLLTAAEEGLLPATPVVTRVDGGSGPLATDALEFSSSAFVGQGGATFAAMKWRIAEVTDPATPGYDRFDHTVPRKYEIEAAWESPELATFTSPFTFSPATVHAGEACRVRVKYKDSAGRWSHWSAPLQFNAIDPDVSTYLDALVVSQFMYHPAEPAGAERNVSIDAGDFEWIELMNTGTEVLDLSPLRFTKGIDFDFAGSAVTTLAPDARVVVVKNQAAFQARYGPGAAVIAGEWASTDNFNNGGEEVKLSFGAGTAIRQFTYDDASPWPGGADGSGHSLVLVAPASLPDHNEPSNWRVSGAANGSPGTGDSVTYSQWAAQNGVTGADSDFDGDGWSNFVEYGLGTNPRSGDGSVLPAVGLINAGGIDYATFTIRLPLAHDEAQILPQVSEDLSTWLSGAAGCELVSDTVELAPLGGFQRVWQLRSLTPWATTARQFMRLRVEAR